MNLRVAIEKQKPWVALACILAIIACVYAGRKSYRGEELSDVVTRVYFSDDDGKTYFAGGIENGLDFMHEGKQAYRAYVYCCDGGKAFVGFLGRRPPGRSVPAPEQDTRHLSNTGPTPVDIEIKRPGEANWVPLGSAQGQQIIHSICSSGSPEAVLP